jgi:hypothetical protein
MQGACEAQPSVPAFDNRRADVPKAYLLICLLSIIVTSLRSLNHLATPTEKFHTTARKGNFPAVSHARARVHMAQRDRRWDGLAKFDSDQVSFSFSKESISIILCLTFSPAWYFLLHFTSVFLRRTFPDVSHSTFRHGPLNHGSISESFSYS